MTIRDTLIDTYSWGRYGLSRFTQKIRFGGVAVPKDGWPVLLGVSFPKSGTNLLRQVLAAFTRVGPFSDRSFDVFAVFDAETGIANTAQDGLRFLTRLRPADIAAAHFHAWTEVIREACTSRYLPYFMYRDPRDVVVSHVFYVTDRFAGHVHHAYYTQVLHTFDERLKTSILGRPDVDVDFPDIGKRFEPYLGWLDQPQVLSQRYEDYIINREAAIRRAVDHFLKRVETTSVLPDRLFKMVERSIVPERSPTFRSGKTGEWQKYFKDEHKAIFKEVAGDLLVRLGYEKDLNW